MLLNVRTITREYKYTWRKRRKEEKPIAKIYLELRGDTVGKSMLITFVCNNGLY